MAHRQNMAERKTVWETHAWMKEIRGTTWLLRETRLKGPEGHEYDEVLDGRNMGFKVKVFNWDPRSQMVFVEPVEGVGNAWVPMDALEHIEEADAQG